ncbi:serine/threonine-protein kinase 11-interacting protein isoform X2 [Pipistrellus kuhlii]|uniref:serine/threonine-protein kinase 11-interacting protein isoform X2 n=1 Tax=Pipistrellus kuhlii TaxID=59472 RepID=UPI001E2700D6|nr:serine/threonine-protein kinase 11-interacting protein isoform X2 [Pipistrellus kuhlii]
MTTAPRDSLLWKLAGLLRESGDVVLSGCSTLSLLTATLQQLSHVFELYLGPWGPGQTGFVALPSHPTDSPVILQLQFLFDVLQKTLSLKLVHVPGPGLPGPIKIFPFKSLRQLELRGVPVHCLHGLRGIYSQLETLICTRSIQTLEELLSACGGDLCSALPWLALLSANFSYNALTALDSSLRLLSALRFLNLSHNQLQGCKDFLMDLSELYHLDISYNHLCLVPRIGPSGATLGTLILRGNELRGLHGLEQLKKLRHLDVAYNLLEEHRALAPLCLLAELRKLYLEGNPLWFHPAHRAATAQYLSPRARGAASGFLLDGKVLLLTDFQTSTSSEAPTPSWPVGSTTETSGGVDLSDSLSSGGIVAQPPIRKLKGRVRVRRASISEPSDTDAEPRTPDPSPAASGNSLAGTGCSTGITWRPRECPLWLPLRLPPSAHCPRTHGAPSLCPVLHCQRSRHRKWQRRTAWGSSHRRKRSLRSQEKRRRRRSRRKWKGPSLDFSSAELCRPMLVCPLEGPQGVRGQERFLRVTSGHLFEVELQAARTLERLELQSLEAAEIEPEPEARGEPLPEGSELPSLPPVLALRFSYIRPDRHLRRYVVLEPDAQAAVQELLAVLTPAATKVQHQRGEARDQLGGRLQCLRCGHDFKPGDTRLEPDSVEGWRPVFQNAESPTVCPNCGSDHVVLLALSGGTPNGEESQEEQLPASSQSPSTVHDDPPGESDDSTRADSTPSQALGSLDRHGWSLSPPPERCGLRSVDHRLRLFLDVEVFTDAQEEFQCCIKVPLALAGHPGECLCLVVVSDHRLYVLKVTGEICGPPASWLQPTLAIPLQDLSCIELGLAGQSLRLEWAAGAGCCVLLPRDAKHCRAFLEELTEFLGSGNTEKGKVLRGSEVGIEEMESRGLPFSGWHRPDVLQSLPPAWRSSVSATEEEVTPDHRFWPLLEGDSSSEPSRFFYLQVFLVDGPATYPVSVLLTLSTLYLLDEDLVGSQAEAPLPAASGEASEKALPSRPGPSLCVREQQPLSSLSSVLLYRTAPEDLRLVFYDEVSRLESFWALRVMCPEQLTPLLAWIREPWEQLFSIGLRTVTQETLDLDR